MTVTLKALQPGLTIGTGDTTLYTAPGGTKASVSSAVFVNTDASPRTLNVRRVSSGGSPDVYLIKGKSLAAGATYVSPEIVNLALEGGDSIVATASVASVVSAVLSGYEIV